MKIVYQNLFWLLTLITYNFLCFAIKNEITIGAFYNEEAPQSKIALERAIYASNTKQDRNTFKIVSKVVPTNFDDYRCSKLACNMTQNHPVAVLFGPSSPELVPILQSICSNFQLPHIQINENSAKSFNIRHTVVNFYPRLDLLSQAIAVIIRSLQWRNFVVIYESNQSLAKLQDIFKLQNFNENPHESLTIRQLGPGPDHRPLLKEILDSGKNHIVLDCRSENIIDILRQAKEVKLMEVSHHSYFLTSLDAHTLNFSELSTTANITTMRIVNPEDETFLRALQNWKQYAHFYYSGKMFDWTPFSIKTETALMYDAAQMFISSVNAFSSEDPITPTPLNCSNPQKWGDGLRISSSIKLTQRLGVSGPVSFDHFGRRNNFTIFVVEGHQNTVLAQWHTANPEALQLMRSHNDTYNALVKNMQKNTLIISSRLGPPYLMKKKPRFEGETLTGNDRYEGFSMDLIREIASVLGFKFEFRLAQDGKYGNYNPKTKSWNGLIKDILDGRADLAICDLTVTHQRREVVDFSMPFMRLGISILYRKAEEKKVNIFAFLDPFSIEIWIYTATLYLAVSLILYVVARMAPGDWENPHPCDQHPDALENIWNVKNCLWLTLGSIMTQGCDILPKGISSRMVSIMWWFFSLLMTSSYTANLAAFLTMERLEPSIDSAEALAKQTKIKYGTVEGGATQAFFRDSNFSTFQRMWTNMAQSKPSVFEKSNADGVKRVQTTRQRLYAFLMESSQIEYEIETKCDLKQVGSWLDSKAYGIAMPIDYPYRSAINTAILKLQEESKLRELKDKWWKKNMDEPTCRYESPHKTSELALDNVGGVFLVLGAGVGLAFLIAGVEFFWNVRKVSVEKHLSYADAFKLELVFAVNFWVTKKRTKPAASDADTKSLGSLFLHFNALTSKLARPRDN